MFRHLVKAAALGALFITSGCLPRGETITLDQVLQDAKNRFAAADRKSVPEIVSPVFEDLSTKLQQLTDANESFDYSGNTRAVSDLINEITPHAGYTSRPSLTELSSQYRFFKAGSSAAETKSKAKLLVSRTYTLLSGELETTKFQM
jgi:hypothetical protein